MKRSGFSKFIGLIALLTALVLVMAAFTACTAGQDGKDGLTPYIGENGNWWIGDTDTGVSASGSNGAQGETGKDGLTPYIGENGNWWIGDTDTGVKAAGEDGAQGAPGEPGKPGNDGQTPTIGENGNWWIGDVDTGVKAEGQDGKPGEDGKTPTIGANGNWWIGNTDTGVKAEGTDGLTPTIGENGNWWIGNTDTGVKAEGQDGKPGEDGKTPYIGENGNWWIGDTDLGVSAGGSSSNPGEDEEDEVVIAATKMASHSAGRTAYPGEKIHYSIAVTNHGAAGKKLTVTDSVPANTTYVSGADSNEGGALTWSVLVPAGETVIVSYTVAVNNDLALCDGGKVESTTAIVADVEAKACDVYIERTINHIDAELVNLAVDAMIGSEYFEDYALAKAIYTVAFSQNPMANATMGSTFADTFNSIMGGTADAKLLDMVAPTLYGGKNLYKAINGVKGAPAQNVTALDFVTGDIIIVNAGGATKCYIYSDNGIFSLSADSAKADKDAIISSLISSDLYVVLRPSTIMTTFTPTDPEKTPDVLNEKQQIIVATAKYYLLRGDWLQYDDTFLCYNSTEIGNESRWQYATHAPEEYTEDMTGFINCAAFTHDIYWTVFGNKLPGGMYTTANYEANASKNNMLVYSFKRTAGQAHTEEEIETVSNAFLSSLQAGDIMVIRRGTSSGHAMLYIGNGTFIHSSGSSYNYSGSYGVETYEPTIRFHKVYDYFLRETSTNGYLFGSKVTGLYVVRPLQNSTWNNYSATEASQNRVNNLQGIVAQKITSVKENVSVNRGDQITYTISIFNTNQNAVTLNVSDYAPANTTLVSADAKAVISGNDLAWVVNVGARETVELTFTVKVNADAKDGAVIANDGAMVGGVSFKTYKTVVKNTLTAEEQQALINAFNELKSEGTTLTGLALVNEIYRRALGVDTIFESVDVSYVMENSTDGVFTPEGLGPLNNGKQAHKTNNGSKYNQLLAGSIYGGRGLASAPNEGIRTRLGTQEHLVVGDIFIGRTSSSTVMYIYLGGDTFVSLSTLKDDTVTIGQRLERGPAYSYYYAALRPSYAFE